MTSDPNLADKAPLLRIRALRSPYAGPFSLDLNAGECVAIQGPSGTGKSVFLRLIADLDPGDGEVRLHNRVRETWSAPEWRCQVVYQSAEPAWWAPTAREHLAPDARFDATDLLARLGLSADILDADLSRTSTGERQRLALIRSLACQPSVLLLDEPTASLDRVATAAVEAVLREQLQVGTSILMVTHSHEQAERIGDRIFNMPDKKSTSR